jgi:hypothetical protein
MHNYLKKLERLQHEGKVPAEKGKSYDAKIAHDDWCHVYNGGECNCDPAISFVEITEKNSEQVAKQIVDDSKEFRAKVKDKIV